MSVLLYCFSHLDSLPESLAELSDLDWSGDQSAPFNTGGRVDHNTFGELMGGNYLQ